MRLVLSISVFAFAFLLFLSKSISTVNETNRDYKINWKNRTGTKSNLINFLCLSAIGELLNAFLALPSTWNILSSFVKDDDVCWKKQKSVKFLFNYIRNFFNYYLLYIVLQGHPYAYIRMSDFWPIIDYLTTKLKNKIFSCRKKFDQKLEYDCSLVSHNYLEYMEYTFLGTETKLYITLSYYSTRLHTYYVI